jgi:hypothetical protein
MGIPTSKPVPETVIQKLNSYHEKDFIKDGVYNEEDGQFVPTKSGDNKDPWFIYDYTPMVREEDDPDIEKYEIVPSEDDKHTRIVNGEKKLYNNPRNGMWEPCLLPNGRKAFCFIFKQKSKDDPRVKQDFDAVETKQRYKSIAEQGWRGLIANTEEAIRLRKELLLTFHKVSAVPDVITSYFHELREYHRCIFDLRVLRELEAEQPQLFAPVVKFEKSSTSSSSPSRMIRLPPPPTTSDPDPY